MRTKRIAAILLLLVAATLFAACAATPADGEETARGTDGETVAVTTAAATTEKEKEAPIVLKIVSMNAQNADYDRSGEPTLESKHQKLAAAIDAKAPDLVLLQECNAEAAEGIRAKLKNPSEYGVVTAANTTATLLYDKTTFLLQAQGSRKIGEKDDEDGSKYDRWFVWAQFRHKASDLTLIAAPIHVDYVTKACKAQLNRIVEYLKTNFPKIPFILGGDFNAEMGTVSATSLTTEGYLDARTTAEEKIHGDETTYPEKSQIIDFVWYKGGMIYGAKAKTYEVITDALPTDHRPICVELVFER